MTMLSTIGNKILCMLNRITHTFESVYLCIRFPFLYPVDMYTGLHYNNWSIIDKISSLAKDAYSYDNDYNATVKNRWKLIKYKLLKSFHDTFLQIIFWIPTYNELDFMCKGWRKTFGIQFCKEIKESLLRSGGREALKNFHITYFKEKNGELQTECYGATREVYKIIEKYEYISYRTCISCGSPAKGLSKGWIAPYCEDCATDCDLYEYYTDKLPWYGYVKF